MKYEFSPKYKLIGCFIGLVAGVYSFFMQDLIVVKNFFELGLAILWYVLLGLSVLVNAWGMLHYVEVQSANQKETE